MPRLTLLPRVAVDGVAVPGVRAGALLAALAADLAAGCSTGRLVAELWPEVPPADPAKALQVVVSRVRARVGPGLVATTPTGYRLALNPVDVDAEALRLHAAEADRAPDPAAMLAAVDAGLALWSGSGDPSDSGPLGALREERRRTVAGLRRRRALALSRLGRAGEALEPLEELVGAAPEDEEVLLELLRSEGTVRGPGAALARYESYRRVLADELGTDPGAALRAQQAALLAESAPARRRGIAAEPNALLGRDGDVAAVLALLHTSRVVTVLGPGGLGKTRLAHAVAARTDTRTVQVVSLAGVRSGADVAAEVADAVRAGGPLAVAAPDPTSAVAEALGSGPALLVLDNCEHVLDAAADLVHALVARARDLRVLVTSRAPLNLASESVYPLPQLDPAVTVALFLERARAARPDVALPPTEVAALCARLDGLPLAVELAAARVRVLPVGEILRRLDDRFALLRGAGRDRPERHRTLEAVVAWSWNLLDDEARTALRTLAALPGGFTGDTATGLLGGDRIDLLETLVDQSLLRPPDATGRFRMLETVREFCAARRAEAGEDALVTGRVLEWGRRTSLAVHAQPFGAEPAPALHLIRAEQENLLHVLRLARALGDRGTLAAVLAALGALWTVESGTQRLLATGVDCLPALARYRPADDAGLAALRQAVVQYATLCLVVDPATAVRPLAVLRRIPPGRTDEAIGAIARVVTVLPDVEALDELCRDPRPLVAAVALGVVGYVREVQGDLAGARAAAREMPARIPARMPWLHMFVYGRLAELSLQLERHDEALVQFGAAGRAVAELGVFGDPINVRLGTVVAHLGLGATGAAERALAGAGPSADTPDAVTFDLVARAELALAKGEVDAGLASWRRATTVLDVDSCAAWLWPYAWSLRAMAVVAHVRHHRLDEVAGTADGLPAGLGALLAAGAPDPVCGTVLLALGLVEVERGRAVRGAWLVAIAERFHYQREYQPTMSGAATRAVVTAVAGPAYAEAVAEYAGLDRDELRAEARDLAAAYRDLV
ncbi:AfsR/SARP family transcriptional regulator [Pseudonocardia kujensis]|uniref:ATP-binding protein n=1 Tax=Pseudonocardia kujensis TaxID=1128675 RepID=UPI001E42E078|nr:BTAD domain-containing putative transcriptional regulator [Pseudonocardia kujensis]MCE0765418.1 AfsR/SARP family transcriptional regulator [Pseudonocardia kujensis]